MKNKILKIFLLLTILFPLKLFALEVNTCEMSEAYKKWEQLSEEEKKNVIKPEYCKSNGLNGFKNKNSSNNKAANYQSSYTASSTPVKDQYNTPACWAYASTTVLESYMLNRYGSNLDLSIQHLNYRTSQSFNGVKNIYASDREVMDGGNYGDSALYYINKYGPVFEVDVPTDNVTYPMANLSSSVYNSYISMLNLFDVNNIEYEYRDDSGPCTSVEKEKIKYLLTNYGPVGVNIWMDNNYLSSYFAFYYTDPYSFTYTNHAVTIVGWDDNYSRTKFKTKPNSNGAWLVQNSYGTSWGSNGYFWVSYEDPEVCTSIFSIRDADPYYEDNNYTYAQTKSLSSYTARGVSTAKSMTVFTKKTSAPEYLTKVAFEVLEPTGYNVYYYKGNAGASNIKTSSMTKIASGSVDYTGWVTVTPNQTIVIPATTNKYSIVVELTSTRTSSLVGKKYYTYEGDLSSNPEEFYSGTSYLYDNSNWFDIYSAFDDGNQYKATISAFTDNVIFDITSVNVNYTYNDKFNVVASVKGFANGEITAIKLVKGETIIAEQEVNQTISNGQTLTLTLEKKGLADFQNGTYQLQIHSGNGIYKTYNVEINVIPISGITIDTSNGSSLDVGEYLQLKAILSPSNHNSTYPLVKWASSDNSIAWVDSTGLVTAVSYGRVTITATTWNGYSTTTVIRVEKDITFKDVKKSDWFYESVKEAYNRGIIAGYPGNRFGPNDKVTRGQLVTFLYRLEGEPAIIGNATFKDVVEGEYYADPVKWAYNNHIVNGYGQTGRFGPNDPIIRQDLAVILNNYAKYKGYPYEEVWDLSKFTDYKKVKGTYAEPALKWAVKNHIISGKVVSGGKRAIAPFDNTTRAEAAAMIINFIHTFVDE